MRGETGHLFSDRAKNELRRREDKRQAASNNWSCWFFDLSLSWAQRLSHFATSPDGKLWSFAFLDASPLLSTLQATQCVIKLEGKIVSWALWLKNCAHRRRTGRCDSALSYQLNATCCATGNLRAPIVSLNASRSVLFLASSVDFSARKVQHESRAHIKPNIVQLIRAWAETIKYRLNYLQKILI